MAQAERKFMVSLKYSVKLEVYATNGDEALQKAKDRISVNEGKFTDVDFKVKATGEVAKEPEKTAEIPFKKK